MEIDIYQTCPCHSEKKIKFCCGKEIVSDLNHILALNKSKQSTAALEHLDRAIAKLGPRDCLLTIKTHILISLHEYEKANEVNQEFLQAHPNHPIGHQHRALLLAAEADAPGAISALQDALDSSPGNEVPISMANAFRIVGMLLLSRGDIVASRAHLIFASELRDGSDETTAKLIMQTYRAPEIPLYLKHDFSPSLPDSETPWSSQLEQVMLYAARGRWRSALKKAEALNQAHPNVSQILYCIATYHSYLAQNQRSAEVFAQLSQIETLPFDERVDALSLALLTGEQSLTPLLDLVRVTYEIEDPDRFSELAVSSPRLLVGSITSHEYIAEGPPPTAGYLLLDRDEVTTVEGADFDQFPSITAEMLVYGKQTDRAARLELFVVRNENFDNVTREVQAIFADTLGQAISEEDMDQISILDHAMSFQWHLPRDMTPEQRREFVEQKQNNEILNVWTQVPFNALDGQTPDQCKDDPARTLALAALVSMMEQGAVVQTGAGFDFDALRQRINVPLPETIDPTRTDTSSLSPVRMQRVEFEKLDDDNLIKTYITASTIGNLAVLRKCSESVLQRPQLEHYVHFELIYGTLAKLTPDTDRAISLIQKARQHAASAGRPVGDWLVDELDLRLQRGRVDSCPELIRTIQANYSDDPNVQYHLAAVLQRYGLIGPDGRMVRPPSGELEPATAASPAGGIWTPDSGHPAEEVAEPAGQPSKSKLWLPD